MPHVKQRFSVMKLVGVALLFFQVSCKKADSTQTFALADIKKAPTTTQTPTATNTRNPVMHADSPQAGRTVQKEHSHQGKSATGNVVLTAGTPETEHQHLAGARAWLLLGQTFLQVSDAEAAIFCGKAGLSELGDDYADPRTTVDDTGMKILAAENQIQKGLAADGASVLLRMLEIRTQLYSKLHAEQILK